MFTTHHPITAARFAAEAVEDHRRRAWRDHVARLATRTRAPAPRDERRPSAADTAHAAAARTAARSRRAAWARFRERALAANGAEAKKPPSADTRAGTRLG